VQAFLVVYALLVGLVSAGDFNGAASQSPVGLAGLLAVIVGIFVLGHVQAADE